jgi:hypothetical protein
MERSPWRKRQAPPKDENVPLDARLLMNGMLFSSAAIVVGGSVGVSGKERSFLVAINTTLNCRRSIDTGLLRLKLPKFLVCH